MHAGYKSIRRPNAIRDIVLEIRRFIKTKVMRKRRKNQTLNISTKILRNLLSTDEQWLNIVKIRVRITFWFDKT